MAQASTLRFSQFLIKLGNGANPEVFAAPCGLNSREFNRTAATNDTNVPDCADPDAPSWLERDTTSLSSALSGSGVVADEDFDDWNDWFESGETKNLEITLGTRTWRGPFKCTALNITGQRGSRTTFTVSMESDGKVVKQ
ncbi:MAG: phage tail protein [Alphaproteobacteria bacterium]|nr:MAG: phage tail protein [Alphaproteobacteria bacterium]